MNYRHHISKSKNIRFGKPCVKGSRISVYDVMGWISTGMTHDQIITDFPELSKDSILACQAYAAARESKVRTTV